MIKCLKTITKKEGKTATLHHHSKVKAFHPHIQVTKEIRSSCNFLSSKMAVAAKLSLRGALLRL
jgi:hypothetical protein